MGDPSSDENVRYHQPGLQGFELIPNRAIRPLNPRHPTNTAVSFYFVKLKFSILFEVVNNFKSFDLAFF